MAAVLKTDGLKDASTQGTRRLSSDPLTLSRKTFSDVYQVRAASKTEDEDDILNADGVPSLGSFSNGAYLVSKSAREVSTSALLWEVTCSYDSNTDPNRPRQVDWSWSAETIEQVVPRDVITGKPVTNAVKEPIIITAPMTIPVLTINRIQNEFLPNTILNFMNRVNSHTFWGAPPKTALMSNISDSPTEIGGRVRRMVTYVIKFNLKWDFDKKAFLGWVSQPLNHGTKYFEDAEADPLVLTHFRTSDGTPTTGNLSPEGEQLALTEEPNYLLYNRFLVTNLNLLNLGPFATS